MSELVKKSNGNAAYSPNIIWYHKVSSSNWSLMYHIIGIRVADARRCCSLLTTTVSFTLWYMYHIKANQSSTAECRMHNNTALPLPSVAAVFRMRLPSKIFWLMLGCYAKMSSMPSKTQYPYLFHVVNPAITIIYPVCSARYGQTFKTGLSQFLNLMALVLVW